MSMTGYEWIEQRRQNRLRAQHTPAFPGSTWSLRSPAAAGFNESQLSAALDAMPGNIAVIRGRFLVAQRGDVSTPIPLYSVSKSLTSLVFGSLLEQGMVDSDDLVPGSDQPTAPEASYRHFMSMTADFGLSPHKPGANYAYNNNATDFYGSHISDTYFGGADPASVLQTAYLDAVGFEDNISFAGQWGGWGGGFDMSARDLARVGLLVLERGSWGTTQLLSESFIDDLYTNQISATAEASTDQGPNDQWNQQRLTDQLGGNYSFGWWTNESAQYPTIPRESIYALGRNGNRLIISPADDLVIAVTATGDDQPPDVFLAPILSALTAADNPNPTITLTVNGGSGDGSYLEGDVITVAADPPPPGETFDQWTGDVTAVGNVFSAATTVTIPAIDVTITATYRRRRRVPRWRMPSR